MREERVFVFKKDGVIETLSQEEFQKRVKTFTPSNLSVSAVERYRLFSLRVKLEGKRYSVQVQLRDEEKRIILSGEKSGAATFNNLLKLLGGGNGGSHPARLYGVGRRGEKVDHLREGNRAGSSHNPSRRKRR